MDLMVSMFTLKFFELSSYRNIFTMVLILEKLDLGHLIYFVYTFFTCISFFYRAIGVLTLGLDVLD